MNNKAQFDEINPAYIGLALIGGGIAYFVSSRASPGGLIPVMSMVASVIIIYLYLGITDR